MLGLGWYQCSLGRRFPGWFVSGNSYFQGAFSEILAVVLTFYKVSDLFLCCTMMLLKYLVEEI